MPQHLTDATIRRLPVPPKGNKITYDDVPGFGCRVTAGGARSFILNYLTKGGRERRITIGACGDWSTSDARREARRLRQLVDQGGDPLANIEAEREAPSMADLLTRYEREYLPRLRESSRSDYLRMIRDYIRPHFGDHTKVTDVRFADVDALHRKVTTKGGLNPKTGKPHGGPYRANRAVVLLSKVFSLAVRWNMRSDNPCKGVEKNTEHNRRRYLSGDELARLVDALTRESDRQACDIIRILLLTGARRGEVLGMKWADVDLTKGIWSKPAASVKQNRQHDAPLSGPARQLLAEIQQRGGKRPLGEYVFESHGPRGFRRTINKAWSRVCKSAGITGLRIHDLRHSFASTLVSAGSSLPLIGALLGHSNPTTTARYSHLFDDPQRAAVEKVAAIVGAAGKPAPEPVKLKPRRR